MFEAAELGKSISKAEYQKQLPDLRANLLQAQSDLKDCNIPLIVIVSGADGAGKGEVIHQLNRWLDPRSVETISFWQSSDEEEERPYYWRFWRVLPARGRMGIFFGSWYTRPIIDMVYKKIKKSELDAATDRISAFEKMLIADGALIIKFWFHLAKKEQKKLLKEKEKNPQTRWRVRPSDWEHYRMYDRFIKASERALRHTDHDFAPWNIIESVDPNYREITTGNILLEKMIQRLAQSASPATLEISPPSKTSPPKTTARKKHLNEITILDNLDLSHAYSDKVYKSNLAKYQGKLSKLAWEAHEKGLSQIAVFEGWDAAGKGSAIQRITEAMDPRIYRVIQIAAPTDEERAHHYLWRFWRHLPRSGMLTIYDRSWYGRVLVERIEKFAREHEWQRAYEEINDFEEQLTDHGILLHKFWIHISEEEQLRRFEARKEITFKRYKITEEDWRNREKWNSYKTAVHDMVNHTSTANSMWTLVPGNDKKYARIMILKNVCATLEKAL